jgi:thiol:disulfide interchange protein DsbG
MTHQTSPHFSRRWLLTALVASGTVLAACKDAPAPVEAAKPAALAVSVAAVAQDATGFSAGSAMSARVVYVFFDPQCPHCSDLWRAAKPLTTQARFVWIPVGLLNDASRTQGAALLAASDPVAAMNAHEASMQAGTGGIGAAAGADAQTATVLKNTELFNRMGFASIPTIVGTHAQTGALVTQEGSMSTAALANLLGLQVPAG